MTSTIDVYLQRVLCNPLCTSLNNEKPCENDETIVTIVREPHFIIYARTKTKIVAMIPKLKWYQSELK